MPCCRYWRQGDSRTATSDDMTRLKISEAAKLVGLDRKTLYKHIKQGKLSAGVDNLGTKYIDPAELHRVYGDFSATGDTGDKPETATLETVVEELRQLRQDHLAVLAELQLLRKEMGNRPLLESKSQSERIESHSDR